jgi:hypothetical protein
VRRECAPNARLGCRGAAGIVVIWFRVAALVEVILANVQLKKRPVCIAKPAQRAGRVQRAGHLVLL